MNKEFSILFLIVSQKLGPKAEAIFAEAGTTVYNNVFAKGTATSEMSDMLGLGSVDKAVTTCLYPKQMAHEMLDTLRDRLYLGTPNTGVAFTIPLSGISGGAMRMMQSYNEIIQEEKEGEKMDSQFTMIMAFVNQGYSDDVMSAAKPAGATGGTVFHSRRVGNEEALKFWGISVQEEREIVLILADKDKKLDIMNAIAEKCGAQTPAHGMIVSLPVDGVAGLNKR